VKIYLRHQLARNSNAALSPLCAASIFQTALYRSAASYHPLKTMPPRATLTNQVPNAPSYSGGSPCQFPYCDDDLATMRAKNARQIDISKRQGRMVSVIPDHKIPESENELGHGRLREINFGRGCFPARAQAPGVQNVVREAAPWRHALEPMIAARRTAGTFMARNVHGRKRSWRARADPASLIAVGARSPVAHVRIRVLVSQAPPLSTLRD